MTAPSRLRLGNEGRRCPGVPRITGSAEVAAMIAPRELVSLTPLPGPFGYTASVYKLHGAAAAARLRQANSLGEALGVGGGR